MPTLKEKQKQAEEQYINSLIEHGNKVIRYEDKDLNNLYEILGNRGNFDAPKRTLQKNAYMYYPIKIDSLNYKKTKLQGYIILDKERKMLIISPEFQKNFEKRISHLEKIVSGKDIDRK